MLFSADLFHTPIDRGFVVKTAAYMFGLLAVLGLTLNSPADAQSPRVQFPSGVPAAQAIPNPLPVTPAPTATLDGTIHQPFYPVLPIHYIYWPFLLIRQHNILYPVS